MSAAAVAVISAVHLRQILSMWNDVHLTMVVRRRDFDDICTTRKEGDEES